MTRLAVIALVLIGAAVVLARSGEPPPRPAEAGAQQPPQAPVRGCRDRIQDAYTQVGGRTRPYRFRVRRAHDTAIGPVGFSGARAAGREWDFYVREDQWLKSIALVRRGERVTLEVPREQRAWMRLAYGGATAEHAVTLAGCRRPATRAECGGGTRRTCRSRVTPFSGGFEIDYARAPRQGRCAELIVWVEGEPEPRRAPLFGAAGSCA